MTLKVKIEKIQDSDESTQVFCPYCSSFNGIVIYTDHTGITYQSNIAGSPVIKIANIVKIKCDNCLKYFRLIAEIKKEKESPKEWEKFYKEHADNSIGIFPLIPRKTKFPEHGKNYEFAEEDKLEESAEPSEQSEECR